VSKKLAIAGTLIVLIILTVSLFSASSSSAASRHKALRYRVVRHARTYDVVRGHHRRLLVRDHHRYVKVHGVRRYRVLKRGYHFVVLRRVPSPSAAAPTTTAIFPGAPLSVGLPSSASSVWAGDSPAAANDGQAQTRWAASSRSYPQWWTVDLRVPTTVDGVKVSWYGARRAYRYRIQTSLDGVAFTTVADRSQNRTRGTTADALTVVARYVRVTILGVSPSGAIASAYEITVNGDVGATPPPTPGPAPAPTATPTPTASPTASPTVTPTPTPTVTPTPTAPPAPAPTVTPTPAPTPAPSGSLGIMTPAYVSALRTKVASGTEPWASAWAQFKYDLPSALAATPDVFVGPDPGPTGSIGTLQEKLDRDGYYARNLGIGYAVSGDVKYAAKARSYLIAWAIGNHPTSWGIDADESGGSYMAHGYFCFAYAYDLTKDSGVYSDSDKATIKAYFRTACDAMMSYLDHWADNWVFTQMNPTRQDPFEWSSFPNGVPLHYYVLDFIYGHDISQMTTVGVLATAIMSDHSAVLTKLFDTTNYRLNVKTIIHYACAPRNDGDGIAGHPVPVPNVAILMPGSLDNPGRGGCVDYMTYVTRLSSIEILMSEAIGKDMTVQRAEVQTSWDYLHLFFGTNRHASPAPRDVIDYQTDLSRFVIAHKLFPSDAGILDAVNSTDKSTLDEVHYLGPTTLTLWPLGS